MKQLDGWDSRHRQTEDGAVESEQRVSLQRPVVAFDRDGARALGRRYWQEVRRSTGGVARPRVRGGGVELRILGRGPALLRFDAPSLEATPEVARCAYRIAGGLLAQRASGEILFEQRGLELRSAIRDFYPALAAREGRPHWTGALYGRVQSRLHVAISRRYFASLIREARG
jgi:hypothetical protein